MEKAIADIEDDSRKVLEDKAVTKLVEKGKSNTSNEYSEDLRKSYDHKDCGDRIDCSKAAEDSTVEFGDIEMNKQKDGLLKNETLLHPLTKAPHAERSNVSKGGN